MFKRILVANRGEIALRIIRACHDLGVEAVAVFSEADRSGSWLRHADDAICIGPPESSKSYLDISRIIAAAEVADVEAIHPGYGFLAENSHFASVCEECNINFIGPSASVIENCGDKARAKELALSAGVPAVPGSDGLVANEDDAARIATEIGYPVMIKATAGGGGRGMRLASNEASLRSGFVQASKEAEAAFQNGDVYLEKFVRNPRHVEVQILADGAGKIVHLGERDCSIQRRHQKLIEESPSPALDGELRQAMGEAAVAFARAAKYENAGTVEFLLDANGNFYFIELNARIQVEHCVTEAVTGEDLVRWQLRIASGEEISFQQDDVALRGHAIEFRINAEDPSRGFAPAPGKIEKLFLPGGPGVRVDSHVEAGYTIPQYYDSMVAKLIVHGDDREQALRRADRALAEMQIEGPGIATTTNLHRSILANAEFASGNFDTGFMEHFSIQ
ncbi:MAG TPA: acetyl-CoA carboxylase biotin carboxylase subunit [Planctomycetes bacterium]|nr:acetyl-CoA carboxylase biotin carboxylase subunit [Planctomycetota bacterium]